MHLTQECTQSCMHIHIHAFSCKYAFIHRTHVSAVMKRNDRIDKRGRSWSRGTRGMEKESRLAKE